MATRAELVRAHFDARASRDFRGAMSLFAPDLVVHMPDAVPFADLDGVDRMAAVLDFAIHTTGGTFASQLVEVVGVGDIAVALVQAAAARDGRSFTHHQAWTYRFEGDVVVETWVHIDRSDAELRALYLGASDGGATEPS